ncbi:carbohydrate kinase family protein, partial [Candidatus Roizmanbacteria bacterium]|nr:carbohydrate kinase family protein [Candidatus Roizmanbacteria bacterium]
TCFMLHERTIVTGSLAYDQILNLPGKFSSYILPEKIHNINVSFTTDTHKKRFGGTGGNQAYSLSLLGMHPTLLATAGNDFQPYLKFLKKNHIDTSRIVIINDEMTAMGIAITDEKDNQIWGFSKGAMKHARYLSIKPLLTNDSHNTWVMITPDEPKAIENYITECIETGTPFSFDPAFYIPLMSKSALKRAVLHARIVFGNDYEIALLKKKIGVTTPTFSSVHEQYLITTFGEKGSEIIHSKLTGSTIKRVRVKPARVQQVIDPTGAGDAYRSGFMAGFLNGKDIAICGQMGSIAAAYAVENYGTMEHSYSVKEFEKRYEENYGPLT